VLSGVADVLTEMTLLLDDRPSSFEAWLERQLDGLAGGIRDDVEAWLRTLHDGGPRTPARGPEAAGNFLARVRPVLTGWSADHHHLREITRDEVLAVLDEHHGAARSNLLVALRSLFTHCQRRKTIFRNPTARIKVGEHPQRVLQPLHPQQVEQAIAAATTPAARLLVTLAVVYGARPGASRALQLDDVDLGNRRLRIADAHRPIDEFTHQVLTAWLEHRRTRWPDTANPHLLINQQTATETGPVSNVWARKPLRGHTATLERLRQDRRLEEALASGGAPLHLAAVFGLDPKTALRYTNAARHCLRPQPKPTRPRSSRGTQGSKRPTAGEHPWVPSENPSVRLNSGNSWGRRSNGRGSNGYESGASGPTLIRQDQAAPQWTGSPTTVTGQQVRHPLVGLAFRGCSRGRDPLDQGDRSRADHLGGDQVFAGQAEHQAG